MVEDISSIQATAYQAAKELITLAKLQPGQLFVVGCSTSEVAGSRIGTDSRYELAEAVFTGIYQATKEAGLFLAAQCCEHLNRALIIEEEAAERYHYAPVNVVPQPKAGGSFATSAYRAFAHPVAVEHIQAHAGMDIGDTLIGMHLRDVAVPVRLSVTSLGEAHLVCARCRHKFIGGPRAMYDEELM
ncbi:MAG: TIGR01440 family protein [Lachnospiraceae bacterium]|nr:TIGR01440 family protein [Lachnospiraceae bacterium]